VFQGSLRVVQSAGSALCEFFRGLGREQRLVGMIGQYANAKGWDGKRRMRCRLSEQYWRYKAAKGRRGAGH